MPRKLLPYPTIAELNALPQHIRDYIHDIETRGDPQYQLRELHELRLLNEQLVAKIAELKEEIERLQSQLKPTGTSSALPG